MASIKLKFHRSKHNEKTGVLFIQVIHANKVRRVRCDCSIYVDEWDEQTGQIRMPSCSSLRYGILQSVRSHIQWNMTKLERIIASLAGEIYSADDIVSRFYEQSSNQRSVFEFFRSQILRMKRLGRIRSGETYQSTLNCFMRFRNSIDIDFTQIDSELMEMYETDMKQRELTRNTTAFYMRTFRTVYRLAVERGLTDDRRPFRTIYCGMDKTAKRAIALKEIKKIKELDLTAHPAVDFARDMFLLSFFLRGMSFVDMAYLRKKDLEYGMLTYRRRKTGQTLHIEWTRQMQDILNKYRPNPMPYLLPIIVQPEKDERKQYQNQMIQINRHLKRIAEMAGLSVPLSLYYSRHSWATIARSKDIPLSVISSALGHTSIETTQIYLDSINQYEIDRANRNILKNI